MAEIAEVPSVESTSPGVVPELDRRSTTDDECPIDAKKPKLDVSPQPKLNLEKKLQDILSCAVCLDLPSSQIFQCTHGHLMCSGCFSHLLADARLKDETATCPNCRCEINKQNCSRNLAVEKAVSELPAECMFCQVELPRNQLPNHEIRLCQERPSQCRFWRIGCRWNGPYHELEDHEESCPHPGKPGREVMESLLYMERNEVSETRLLSTVMAAMSLEKIAISDLQLRTYRTEDFVTRVYWESSRFSALGHQWVLRGRVECPSRDPTLTCDRKLSLQVVMKSRLSSAMEVQYLFIPGPNGECQLKPRLFSADFSSDRTETDYRPLPLVDGHEFNRLMAQRSINLRLFLFQTGGKAGGGGGTTAL